MIVAEGFDGFSMQKLAKVAGVSPATLYIYFKDREDLIIQLAMEEGRKMTEATLENFDPEMPFSEGLRVQWMNRAHYSIENPQQIHFLEQIKHSPLHEKAMKDTMEKFRPIMKEFVMGSIERNELVKVTLEVYWSVAFAPLYNLVNFHHRGRNIAGQPFTLTDDVLLKTLELVLKALKP